MLLAWFDSKDRVLFRECLIKNLKFNSFFPLFAAVETYDEIGHGLVGASGLHLGKASVFGLARSTLEETFNFGALLQLFTKPVRPLRISNVLLHLRLSLSLLLW